MNPVYADDLVDNVPDGWSVRPFEELVYFQEGPGIRNWQYVEAGIPFVNIRCLVDGRLDRQAMSHVAKDEALGRYRHFLLDVDDYVVSSSGTLGRIATVQRSDLPCMLNTSVIRMRPKTERLDRGYLKYFLLSEYYQAQVLSFATGSAQLNYGPMHLRQMFVVCPPLFEQRAIAHILGTLDDKIELNRRMSETLEALARALFKSWFVDFDPVRAKAEGRDPGLPKPLADLFPARLVDSELGEIPEGWEVTTLGGMLELAYGKALKAEDRRDGDIAVYGSNGQVGWHDERLVTGPGIVVGRKGNPGIATWVPTDFYPIDTTFYVVPTARCGSLTFLFHALRIHDLASLGADSAVPGLNRNLAYMSSQVLPAAPVLAQFEGTASRLSGRVSHANDESRTLAALRDTLLPKLISGELRITDAEEFIGRAV